MLVSRDVQESLFDWEYFYEGILYAFEQTDFCDFEIQLEIVHNAVHARVGGTAKFSMASADYTAFDPIFFLHHANVDRLWAIWQDLQRFRKLPYNRAECALNLMAEKMSPFKDANHPNQITRDNSAADDTWDYQNTFGYKYDNLDFHGMGVAQLEALLMEHQSNDRLFAGFLLHNIGQSAEVEIKACIQVQDGENCENVIGVFSVLGGDVEMPFTFDRLYKQDITDNIRKLGLHLDASDFRLAVTIRNMDGTELPSDSIPPPTLLFVPGQGIVVTQCRLHLTTILEIFL
jgi:hypothetical protein